jgi:8-oxo-dGTP diphosphatase
MPHIHKDYDFVAVAFIVYKNSVLLADHPRYGMWFPIGGHIELDEDPEQALYREVKEETNLSVRFLSQKPITGDESTKSIIAPQFMDVTNAGESHKHIGLVYFAQTDSDKFTKSDEHSDMRWFNFEDLIDSKYKIPKLAKFYAFEALKAFKIDGN